MNAGSPALRSALVTACLTAAGFCSAATPTSQKIDELVALHDLKSAVAIGNYYLKQRTLIAVRSTLVQLGKEQNLGPQWNPSNPYWKQAETEMVRAASHHVEQQFSDLGWLSKEWAQLDQRAFSDAELDVLLEHFKTRYGRKQLMLVDHGVALHVQGALTFTDKLVYEVPGAEEERQRMEAIFAEEDRNMRYDIDDSPEATRFVMSAVGRRYFVNAMLNVAGMISRRIDETAASIPLTVKTVSDQATPAVQAFLRSRPEG